MADFVDHALRVFGTPERQLRRRWLHPFGIPPPVEETDDEVDAQEEEAPVPPPPPPKDTTDTTSWTDYIIGLFFHLTALAFFIYIKVETDMEVNSLKEKDLIIPESDTYGGMWKFIGHLNFHALAGYFFLALTCDLLPWMKRELRHFLDFIFTTTIFPCALAVTLLFWTMTTYVRGYGVDAETDPMSVMLEVLPPYINHGWHSAVGFAVVIEVLVVRHLHSSDTDAIKTMFIWNSSHALWLFWCSYHGAMPYPLLNNSGLYVYFLPLFLLFLFIANIIFYSFGKALSLWSWAE